MSPHASYLGQGDFVDFVVRQCFCFRGHADVAATYLVDVFVGGVAGFGFLPAVEGGLVVAVEVEGDFRLQFAQFFDQTIFVVELAGLQGGD